MRKALLLVLVFTSLFSVAQTESVLIQKEIDETVWKPFQAAFETLDGEILNTLYADNVLRVASNRIDMNGDFKEANIINFANRRDNNTLIKLDFWFDSRSTNGDASYEVGYFRIKTTIAGESKYTYGQFHIVIKKIEGVWKITQDWDTTVINGRKIGEEDFSKKNPIKF